MFPGKGSDQEECHQVPNLGMTNTFQVSTLISSQLQPGAWC